MICLTRPAIAIVLACSLGCTSISDETKEDLAAPVNCDTAEQDIATLEAERASVAKQIGSGMRMVVPVALVLGILRRDMRDRAKVAAGTYNRDIEAKIAEIQQTCGLSPEG